MPWLIADGIKYIPWVATDEATFEDYFKQYFEKVFGEKSVLFDKKKMTSLAGISSMPDAFVVSFETKSWFIVKVELANTTLEPMLLLKSTTSQVTLITRTIGINSLMISINQ